MSGNYSGVYEKPPFSESQRKEIATISAEAFRSDVIDPEVIEDYGEWVDYVADYAAMVHTKYGYYVHYPFEGGYLEQPWRLMQIYNIMQGEYRKVLKEKAVN